MSDQYHLTKREFEVAELLLQGNSNKQIALALNISESTVEFHLSNIYTKLGVSSAKEAILILGKSTGVLEPGKSPVDQDPENRNNGGVSASKYQKIPKMQKIRKYLFEYNILLFILIGSLILYWICAIIGKCPLPLPTPSPTSTESKPTDRPTQTSEPTTHPQTATPTPIRESPIIIMLDDFNLPPYSGESVYPYNRLQGNRGIVNGSVLEGGNGWITTTVASGNTWGGAWMSLNHPIDDGLYIDFARILPAQIRSAYQSQITGISVQVKEGTPNRPFKIELKDGDEVRWVNEITLTGEEQMLKSDLPPLGEINQLVWILDRGLGEDYVVLDSIVFTATTPISDTATAAFVWSYGMLLNNWNPETGLVRDKARDASGIFDAIQATGCLATATALAEQLGVISHGDAVQIVEKISQTLLSDLPRYKGLWPHWVKVSPDGQITIVEGTEWSSVDTAIAALGLLTAQESLGLDTSDTENMLRSINWNELIMPGGISHGYAYSKERLPYAWDVFGGESWLVELAYAVATGQATPLTFESPPTANGSGFIDEMTWLFVPPPTDIDYWHNDWNVYRSEASKQQTNYYTDEYPDSCFTQIGLFGLSAGEVPSPPMVDPGSVYQAFGLGGQFASINDGAWLAGWPVVVPHYAGLVALLRPEESIQMWDWLIHKGYFSPLTNVESLGFFNNQSCESTSLMWNQLKGSWNLSLQTLGWGRYLAQRDGQVPILWQATTSNTFLQNGYQILVTGGPIAIPTPTPISRVYERECEHPDEYTVGQTLERSNAAGGSVHGQFGTTGDPSWPPKPGYVKYTNIDLPQTEALYLKLRYSKYSQSIVPILIFINDETIPRATIIPEDQGSWEGFVWTESIPLGSIGKGTYTITFSTEGQQYGTADLDRFVLEVVEVPNEEP